MGGPITPMMKTQNSQERSQHQPNRVRSKADHDRHRCPKEVTRSRARVCDYLGESEEAKEELDIHARPTTAQKRESGLP
jgi:hypothetical protein